MGQAVLRLLLACILFPDAVIGNVSTGVILGHGASDALLADRENCVSACSSWFSLQFSKFTSVAIQGKYFDRSNSTSSP